MGLLVSREGCPYAGQASKYTPEFREHAVRLVIEAGLPVAHVAAEIGFGEQVLRRLVRRADAAGDSNAVLDADERAEWSGCATARGIGAPGRDHGLTAREDAELRLDREFLKK